MQGELDELEREEFFRLKKVQKSKHAKQKIAVCASLVVSVLCGNAQTWLHVPSALLSFPVQSMQGGSDVRGSCCVAG